jgi:TonB family protein
MAEAWTQWEGRTVNGVYPLRRFLNASDHSSVFLTESSAEGFLNAAIKLVPADPATADLQLWHWKTAATFSHPNLIRLLDSGQCEIDGHQLLFIVMEYAEETLSQVLPYRALAADEVRELLVPTLDALASLHRENWIQGQLRPSNFLVVNDHLKLAMDTIRPVGVARERVPHPTLYDAPEVEVGEISVATDVWALGVTLVEALTQYAPTWPGGRAEPPAFPSNLPPSFAAMIQRCLRINPADRPTISELQEETSPAAAMPAPAQVAPLARQAPVPPAAPSPMTAQQARQEIADRALQGGGVVSAPRTEDVIRADGGFAGPTTPSYPAEPEPEKRRSTGTALVALVVVLVAVWGGMRLIHHGGAPSLDVAAPAPPAASSQVVPPARKSTSPAAATSRSTPASAANATSAPSSRGNPPASASSDDRTQSVVHQEIPKVSPASRETIHGHIKIAVKVTVDRSGNVVRDSLENASSSKYFNRVASEAARKWRFASANDDSSRQWLLHFEFGRDGTTVHATRSGS